MKRTSTITADKSLVPFELECPLRLEAEIQNIDTNEFSLQFRFETSGGEGSVVVARALMEEPRNLANKLLNAGASRRAMASLNDALKKQPSFILSTTCRSGWKGKTYLRPGFTVGELSNTLKMDGYYGKPDIKMGKRKSWIRGLKTPCQHSSFLTFCIGTCFGSPLLSVIDEDEGALFNFHGESSTGKSMAARAAQSVFTSASKSDVATYDITDRSLEELCFARNDVIVVLDEQGRISGSNIKRMERIRKIAFTVPGGHGRELSAVVRSVLPHLTWRLFGLSSGEEPLETSQSAVPRSDGERVRHIDIRLPSRSKGGIFDRFEGSKKERATKGAALARAVEGTLVENYGMILEPFIKALLKIGHSELKVIVNKHIADFIGKVGAEADAWERRFARKFGIVFAGMMLAVRAKVAPWNKQQALKSAVRVYRSARRAVCTAEQEAAVLLRVLQRWAVSTKRVPVVPVGSDVPKRLRSTIVGFRRHHENLGEIVAIDPAKLERKLGSKASLMAFHARMLSDGICVKDKSGKQRPQIKVGGYPRKGRRCRWICFSASKLLAT